MFLKGLTQLMSIPFIIWVFMLVTFGVTELFEGMLLWRVNIAFIILFTTAALIPYLTMLYLTYSILRGFEKKVPREDIIGLLDRLKKYSLYYTGVLFLSLPFVYWFVEVDDSPGLLLMYIVATGAGLLGLAVAYLLKDILMTYANKKGDYNVTGD
jgi:hypothetical protein